MGKKVSLWCVVTVAASLAAFGAVCGAVELRYTMNLNGRWEFEQTKTAFPPERFSRTIPVPGLIGLARPKLGDYDKLFRRPEAVEHTEQYDLLESKLEPKYNWYRR